MENVKFYSNRSNAKRAAIKEGINVETASLIEKDGKYAYVAVEAKEETKLEEVQAEVTPELPSKEETKVEGQEPVEQEPAKVEEPAAPAPVKSAKKERIEKNGVKRPSTGTKCGDVWDALDSLQSKLPAGKYPAIADIQAIGEVKGWNRTNTSVEYYGWRKFNGITGRK